MHYVYQGPHKGRNTRTCVYLCMCVWVCVYVARTIPLGFESRDGESLFFF